MLRVDFEYVGQLRATKHWFYLTSKYKYEYQDIELDHINIEHKKKINKSTWIPQIKRI